MMLRKWKSRVGRPKPTIALAEEVDELRRHDWSDPLFDEWLSSAARRLAPDAERADIPKEIHCRAASKAPLEPE